MGTEVPRVWLADDGEHVWFDHICPYVNPETGINVQEWATSQGFSREHYLPLGPDGWTLVSKDPLTITPSIMCGSCGLHGFFTNGQWVPC